MKKGIWKFDYLFKPFVRPEYRISLNEGNNSIVRIPFGHYRELYFLREDENPSGSHKDRYMAFLISLFNQKDPEGYTISSTGNAGISLARFAQAVNKPAIIFLKDDIPDQIVEDILSHKGMPVLTNKPINYARAAQRILNFTDMRASNYDASKEGHKTIPAEIAEKGPNIDSLFVYSTSLSTIHGIIEGYDIMHKKYRTRVPGLYAVISGNYHPFKNQKKVSKIKPGLNKITFADDINIIHCGLKDNLWNDEIKTGGFCPYSKILMIDRLLQKHNGSFVYQGNKDQCRARGILEKHNIHTSYQSLTAIQTALNFMEMGIISKPMIILSGKAMAGHNSTRYRQYIINDLKGLKRLLNTYNVSK